MADSGQNFSARISEMPPPPPHTALAQLSYAPTVQTTVVTTTTTTTTSFPPFLLKAPRNLQERDPEQYPLASNPTPLSLRNLRLHVDGRVAYFKEAEDTGQQLEEFNRELAALHSHSGVLRSVKISTSATPRKDPQNDTYLHGGLQSLHEEQKLLRTQSLTPMSASDSAELQSLRRRNKKARIAPARLDTADFEAPGSRRGVGPGQAQAHITNTGPSTSPDRELRRSRRSSPMPSGLLSGLRTDLGGQNVQRVPHINEFEKPSLVPGSTTPPSAETDLELFETIQPSHGEALRSVPPPSLDTSPFQETSLPSPSLSPTTAAANLSRSLANSRLRRGGSEEPQLPSARLATEDEYMRRTDSNGLAPQKHLFDAQPSSAQRPAPSFTDIPSMLDSFDAMPDALKTYVMYQMLRRCSKSTLHLVADVVEPALKCDFLTRLPLELGLQVLQHLDAKGMCRAAQVSKKWRLIVNSDEAAWKDLLDADGYEVPEGEIQRAIEEGWGWQTPYGTDFEINLGTKTKEVDVQLSSTASPSASSALGDFTQASSPKRKRKSSSKHSSQKKQKKKATSNASALSPSWLSLLGSTQGPNGYANAGIMTVSDPKVGLPSLSNFHLFKSLYQRHHEIRQSWMNPRTKPRHLAFRAHQRHVVTCLQFDSGKIITGSDDANIDIYDTLSGASVKRLQGHEGGVWALEYKDNTLVSGSTDRSVRIWNIEEGRCLHVFQGHTSTVRCLQIVEPVEVNKELDGTPNFMPKQPLIITGSRDSTCRVWKLPKADDVSFFQAGPTTNDYDNPFFVRALTGHGHSVRAIAAWGDTLVSGSYDATVRVWKISTGETIHRLLGHTTKVYSVVLDHERGRCISGSMDYLVKVWSLETGNLLFNLEGHTSLVGLLDLRDDCLVSAAADSTLRIWDPKNGRCKHVLSAHTGAITCFSHDGQKVISGSDSTLKMWNTKTGECVKDLLTGLSGVWQIKFDERRCIAAVQRNDWTYIEVLDFGATRDGVAKDELGERIVVNPRGVPISEDEDLSNLQRVQALDDDAQG